MQPSVADPVTSDLDPTARPLVIRRARRLCGDAEPHTTETPCPVHLQEAHRQLLAIRV